MLSYFYPSPKVDTKGKVDAKRILSLQKLDIKDETWQKAMSLISEAITVTGRKQYTNFKKRELKSGKWLNIRLDYASL